MNEKNGDNYDESDPVCEPTLIKCELTFQPAPGFEYLDKIPLGETESCEMAPLVHIEVELKPVNAADNPPQ